MLYDPVGGWGFEWDTQCLLLSKTVGVLNQGAQGESEVGSKRQSVGWKWRGANYEHQALVGEKGFSPVWVLLCQDTRG